jgi:glyoxylase-like metal-dependent hydrolase (beta-lactamase superfamily II)
MAVIENVERIRYVTAANPGYMTLKGTNQYLLGKDAITVIDVALGSEENLNGLLREASAMGGSRIEKILLTHIHMDHCGGAPALKERTAAQVGISKVREGYLGGEDFTYAEGDRISYDGGELVVVFTPGHESGHCCFYEPEQKILFTGDHILGMGTTVVPAGDGNMAHYMESLRKLLSLDIRRLLPGHGPVVKDARAKIEEYIEHRLMREQQILACLREQRHTIGAMVEVIYEAYPQALMQVAHRSVEAHLLKLIADDRVRREGSRYYLTGC